MRHFAELNLLISFRTSFISGQFTLTEAAQRVYRLLKGAQERYPQLVYKVYTTRLATIVGSVKPIIEYERAADWQLANKKARLEFEALLREIIAYTKTAVTTIRETPKDIYSRKARKWVDRKGNTHMLLDRELGLLFLQSPFYAPMEQGWGYGESLRLFIQALPPDGLGFIIGAEEEQLLTAKGRVYLNIYNYMTDHGYKTRCVWGEDV